MITKKTILIAGALLFFGIVPHVLAEGFVALAPIPGLTDIQPTQEGLATFFNNLYKFAIGMAAVLAIIQIIWGGIEIATNKDNVSKIIDSKGRILQAVLGLVLVLSPVLVFSIINPSILNLSINLEPLDTRSVPPVQTTTDTRPICTSVLRANRTNCIPRADALNTVEGYYATPPTGAVCVELIPPNPRPSTFQAYFCTSTMEGCSLNAGGRGSVITTIGADNIVGGSSGCRQY